MFAVEKERGMKEMHVSEAKVFRIQGMPEHLEVIMEDSKKEKKRKVLRPPDSRL